ncbi:ATP-binding protein [Stenotrophomonas maltophilia]|nr:ATP-binding protein [Stenotrophomonas maltophilia]
MAAVSREWVEALVQDRAQESVHLDFKREQPSKKEDGRKELLKDVCALANTEGGRIVYGVEEDDEACASPRRRRRAPPAAT